MEGGVAGELGTCRGCEIGKPLAKPHTPKDVLYRATRKLEPIHADLTGPMRQQPWGGTQFIFVLVDDYSRKSWVILFKHKYNVEPRLKDRKPWWKMSAEKRWGNPAQTMGEVLQPITIDMA